MTAHEKKSAERSKLVSGNSERGESTVRIIGREIQKRSEKCKKRDPRSSGKRYLRNRCRVRLAGEILACTSKLMICLYNLKDDCVYPVRFLSSAHQRIGRRFDFPSLAVASLKINFKYYIKISLSIRLAHTETIKMIIDCSLNYIVTIMVSA